MPKGHKPIKQENLVSILRPDLLVYFKNLQDSVEATIGQTRKIDMVCPDCGLEKQYSMNGLCKRGFKCPICSDGISIPEKMLYTILEKLDVNFLFQKTFIWSNRKQYDFYIPSMNMIIETHGMQHYKQSTRGAQLSEIEDNDKAKESMAKNNKIENYISIDCRYSDKKWLKDNFERCLNDYFNLSKLNLDECYAISQKSMLKKVCEIWNSGKYLGANQMVGDVKLSRNTIINYLKTGNELGFCSYDPALCLKNIAAINGATTGKEVVCITTGVKYDSASIAGKMCGVSQSGISSCCLNKNSFCGIADGEPLLWSYLSDWENLTDIEKNNTKAEKYKRASLPMRSKQRFQKEVTL